MFNNRTLSPIRNLADFYERKLNRLQGPSDLQSTYKTTVSPKKRSQRVSNNQTYIDIDQMTANDVEKLAKSPPKIATRRKNMKVINSKAMAQFGSDAFNIKIERDDPPQNEEKRLKTQKSQIETQNNSSQKTNFGAEIDVEGMANTVTATPRGKSQLQLKTRKPRNVDDRKQTDRA